MDLCLQQGFNKKACKMSNSYQEYEIWNYCSVAREKESLVNDVWQKKMAICVFLESK